MSSDSDMSNVPEWLKDWKPSNPERLDELLAITGTRGLTDEEAEELYELSDGPSPPPLDQEIFLAGLNFRIGIAESTQENGR